MATDSTGSESDESEIDESRGIVNAPLKCQRCEKEQEQFIALGNWMDNVECTQCGRNGPFKITGNGRIEFEHVRLGGFDTSGFEQITYEPSKDDFEPPEHHHKVGENQYRAEKGDVSELNESVKLIAAHDSAALDEKQTEEQLPDWGGVKLLFKAEEKNTTTEAYNKAAKIIDHKYNIKTVRTTGHVYFYDKSKGIYVLKGETYLDEIINRNLGNQSNDNRRREIRERIKTNNYVDRDELQRPVGKVCLLNGVLDLETLELEPYSPKYFFTARIHAEWPEDGEPDPRAEARWLQALKDGHNDPAEREKIQRWIGYALEHWHHDLEKNMIFVGYRRSGKSTIQEAIQALFGSAPTTVNLSPQQIADSQFDAGRLREAALNTVNDINATKIENSGKIKRILSGEETKLEDKHKDAEFGAPNAKHLWTANWLPPVTGNDEAFFRRVMVVEFLKKVSQEKEDSNYKKRMKRDDVQQAVLVNAVKARNRLREDNSPDDPADYFPNDRDAAETRQIWDSWKDAHKRFLYLQFEVTANPDDQVEREAYWQAAHEFATRNGWKPKGPRSMTQSLNYTPGVYTSTDSDHYGGLKWRDVDAAEIVAEEFDSVDEHNQEEESTQQFLTLTQQQKRDQVEAAIEEAIGEESFASREDIFSIVEEDKRVSRDSADHILTDMLEEGVIYEPQTGSIRFT